MDRDKRPKSRKLGPNRGEEAVKRRKVRVNFSESRDIREDRGTRQDKSASRKPAGVS